MTKLEFKKIYSHYRRVNSQFRADLEHSNYPCGYDDMLCDNFKRHHDKWLDNNPVIRQVLSLNDYDDDYHPVTESFREYRYQNSWVKDGKREWFKREV